MNKRWLSGPLDGGTSPLLAMAVAASQIEVGHHKDALLDRGQPAAELHPNYRVPPAWAASYKSSTHNK